MMTEHTRAHVYGHSDDLIVAEGDVSEEYYANFGTSAGSSDSVASSSTNANYGEPTEVGVLGATIQAEYNDDGEWELDVLDTEDGTSWVMVPPKMIDTEAINDYTDVVIVSKQAGIERDLPLDWDELQSEVGEWAREQFGEEQPFWYCSKGMYEEFGELTHSDLKRDQGIRLDEDGVGEDAERDAVGDIAIYCLDYLERCPYDLTVSDCRGVITKRSSAGDAEDAYAEIGIAITNLHNTDSSRSGICLGVDRLFTHLRQWCEYKGYDFERCVVEAWDGTVSQRQWEAAVGDS